MYQLFESLKIALAAIWANKLRSFLTVLGNIVAVTSIIAVVSLVQGIDDYVSDAIVADLGVGTFSVQRYGMVQNEDDFEKMLSNPPVTERDAVAVRTDVGWTIEMALPLGSVAPKPGDMIGLNLCRTRPARPQNEPEFSSWVFTGESFHQPAKFGHLVFGE